MTKRYVIVRRNGCLGILDRQKLYFDKCQYGPSQEINAGYGFRQDIKGCARYLNSKHDALMRREELKMVWGNCFAMDNGRRADLKIA